MIPEAWIGWTQDLPLAQVVVAFAVVGVLPLMAEMGYLHHRGNYHRWPMFVPVLYPPLFAAGGVVFLVTLADWAALLLAVLSVGLVLMGAAGFFFHLQGIARQTGGFNLDNVMVGPPMFSPLYFSALGALTLVGVAYAAW